MKDQAGADVLKTMIAKANGKFRIAGELFGLGYFDDAVSRAYYAVFHALSAVLLSAGLTNSRPRSTVNAPKKT